ncbi:MAG: hypothetical protein JWN23_891 [Rhodocyclales bacterium]|nr:hypothetical protein [Rhodocyclales bacterium]
MNAPDRHVRHLRLKASSEADVRSVITRLEDALRCATLPDDGARVRVVRKLALGRIASGISSQTLSLIIERRIAELGTQWIAGGTPAAEHATCVDFVSALEARTQLALRLVRGEPCDAWYWPLAVPEFRAAEGVASNLQCIAIALAALPEARVALPAWIAKLVDAGLARQLIAAIPEAEAEGLLQQAGIALLPASAAHSVTDNDKGIGDESARKYSNSARSNIEAATPALQPRDLHDASDATLYELPHWLRSALAASTEPRYRVLRNVRAVQPAVRSVLAAAQIQREEWKRVANAQGSMHGDTQSDNDKRISENPLDSELSVRVDDDSGTQPTSMDPIQSGTPQETDSVAAFDAVKKVSVTADSVQPYLAPTHCGGLLFLLPVLARLGLIEWAGDDAGEFAGRVLRAALRRLEVPAEDPAWSMVAGLVDTRIASPNKAPAPASWADPLLRVPRNTSLAFDENGAPASLAQSLALASNADEQALIWLTAARRWLRRAGGIGLASLVMRLGRIDSTPTHIDIHFRIDDIDMRVRRLGLDIDPGWLSWLGRVVSFHYTRGAE